MSFRKQSVRALGRPALQANLRKATGTALHKREIVVRERPDFENLRDRGRSIRMHAVEHLPVLLDQYVAVARRHGFHIHHARDAHAACALVFSLLQTAHVRLVVKGKSMVTEEIELRPFLEQRGIAVLETDLGEYLIQLAHEMPSHITAPALHKSRAEIGALLHQILGIPLTDDPPTLVREVRRLLRGKFFDASAGISGANFLCADTGTLVLLENEGNIRLSVTLPKLHIAVVGIDKIIPHFSDLPTLLALLPRSATGQKITSYVTCITHPAPAERHVILLDNGREKIQKDPELREMLSCIKCGACLNICPVYQHVGGHAYTSVYPGPIGSLLTPALTSQNQGADLPFASSLCGACADICPVKINIPHLLLRLRARSRHPRWKRWLNHLLTWILSSSRRYRIASRLLRLVSRPANRRLPFPLAPRTYKEMMP